MKRDGVLLTSKENLLYETIPFRYRTLPYTLLGITYFTFLLYGLFMMGAEILLQILLGREREKKRYQIYYDKLVEKSPGINYDEVLKSLASFDDFIYRGKPRARYELNAIFRPAINSRIKY